MKIITPVCILAFIILGSVQAKNLITTQSIQHFGEGRCRELYVNDIPDFGKIPCEDTLLSRGFHFPSGYSALYLAEVMPGREYTLGFSCPAENQKVAVSLFDRWPYAPGAKRVDLPAGPAVRTNYRMMEYLWRVSISPRSTSTLLYIVIEIGPLDRTITSMPYAVFITTPPTRPLSIMGRGITFLQGPRNFVLVSERALVSYVVERPRPILDPSVLPILPIPGDIIKNGWFKDGLNHWHPHRNYEVSQDVDSFSLHQEGLRIWSSSTREKEGILQIIDTDVMDAEVVILRADVRLTKQTLGGTGPDGGEAPVAIAICYEDVEGVDHCNDNAFWMGFYSLEPEEPNRSTNGQKVPEGLWYRYLVDLGQLDPRPKTIKYVSLEGSGWPEREGWVRDVHLIKRGEKP